MRKMLILVLCVVALAACGQSGQGPTAGAGPTSEPPASQATPAAPTTAPATATGGAQPTPQPTTVPVPSAPASEPAPSAQPRPGGMSVAPPAGLVEAAQQQLAKHLNLKPEQIVLQSANKQEWPDGSLGCPQEGMAYPQIITEGFLLIFTNPAQTTSYEVHTAMASGQMVLCQSGRPANLSTAEKPAVAPRPSAEQPMADAARPAVDAAKAALAKESGARADEIAVVTVEPVEWNDSSLGCAKPGQIYMQVITAGYKVVLEARGQRYEYHTDGGKRAVHC